ncbi:MAG: hypothetical protein ABFD50_02025 [Smithella sp.]
MKNIERTFLSIIFLFFFLLVIVLVEKATLNAFGIYSSTTSSIVYYALFGAAFIFTKYIYYSMHKLYQYVTLAVIIVVCGLLVWFVLNKV